VCSPSYGKTVTETIFVDCRRCTCARSSTDHNWVAKSEIDVDTKQVWHTYEVCTSCYRTQNHWYLSG
jgi:hypothetical protein